MSAEVAPVRILYNIMPPWRYDCLAVSNLRRSNACANPGAVAEIIGFLFHKAHLPYELVPFDEGSSAYAGLLDQLENGSTADMAGIFWTPLKHRLDRFAATERMAVNEMYRIAAVFAANASAEIDPVEKYLKFMNVYSTTVWVCVFTFILMSKIYVKMLVQFKQKQIAPKQPRSLAAFFPGIGLTSLLIALMINLYRAGLLSSLLVRPPEVLWFDTVEELFELVIDGDTRLLAEPGAAISDRYIERERGYLKMAPIPDGSVINVGDLREVYRRLAERQEVFLGYHWNIQSTLDLCGFRVVNLEFIAAHSDHLGQVLLFNKRFRNSTVLRRLNEVIRTSEDFVESTIQRYEGYLREVVPDLLRHCPLTDSPTQQSRTPRFISKVTLVDFGGMYFGYVVGVAVAAAIFLLEFTIQPVRRCMRHMCSTSPNATSSFSSFSTASWEPMWGTQPLDDYRVTRNGVMHRQHVHTTVHRNNVVLLEGNKLAVHRSSL